MRLKIEVPDLYSGDILFHLLQETGISYSVEREADVFDVDLTKDQLVFLKHGLSRAKVMLEKDDYIRIEGWNN